MPDCPEGQQKVTISSFGGLDYEVCRPVCKYADSKRNWDGYCVEFSSLTLAILIALFSFNVLGVAAYLISWLQSSLPSSSPSSYSSLSFS